MSQEFLMEQSCNKYMDSKWSCIYSDIFLPIPDWWVRSFNKWFQTNCLSPPAAASLSSRALGIVMEQVNFGYSMKNIPIASRKEYIIGLTHSVREFVNNLRWRVLFHLNPSRHQGNKKIFGLKSTNRCEPVSELEEFEEKLYNMTKNIKFREVSNTFHNKLRAYIN